MTILAAIAATGVLLGAGLAEGAEDSKPAAKDAYAIMAEVDRIAAKPLWPGFDLKQIPVALYDGRRTMLFRHPKPPEGFVAAADHPGVWIADGLHKDVRANTASDIGGVLVAVVMLDSLREARSPADCAAVVAHEAFHVYQGLEHKDWGANEADLFTYPVEDADLLQLRRLESESLRRALVAARDGDRKAWAALAMRLRRERYAALGAAGSGYERGTEKKEGLAQFVQTEALGATEGLVRLTPEEFPPDAVRLRSYSTGVAIALLLNDADPGWKAKMESGKPVALDELLSAALADVQPAEFTAEERGRCSAKAKADVAALSTRREKTRADFLSQDGWRVSIVAAEGHPLRMRGFDPMNVQRLSPQEVLHTRWLTLGNETASLEVLDRRSLTRASGPHPLFSGVAQLTVTGLTKEPEVARVGDKITVRAEGLTADLNGARLLREGRSLTLELVATPAPGPK
jgi:hypothetical protein